MPQEKPRHGPCPYYESKEAKYQAKKARQRQRYQQRQASQRNRVFDNAFSGPTESFPRTRYNIRQPSEVHASDTRPTIDDEFLPQFDDEIELFLPPPSPLLGSTSMDISNQAESGGAMGVETVLGLDESEDIVEVRTEGDADDTLGVEKLAHRLAGQLLRFHGCCNSCHVQIAQKHAQEHDVHHSFSSYMNLAKDNQLYGCSDILGSGRIATYTDKLNSSTTPEQKRWMFTGLKTRDPAEKPVNICLQENDTPCRSAKVKFDIDSIVGFPMSLGISRCGIHWNPTQMDVSDLQSGLHLPRRRVYFSDSHGHPHAVSRPVHEIPHYTLGRLVEFEQVSLCLLFPRLYREDQKSSRLLDSDFEKWMDCVLLPAIYRHSDSDQTQHYPSSYQHSKYNSTARGVEGRSQKVDVQSRVQQLAYPVPPERLHDIWQTVLETVEQPGLQHFKGVTILLYAKNLKTLIKGSTWMAMLAKFDRHWRQKIKADYLSGEFYYDIGKEICPKYTYLATQDPVDGAAEILLWKRCCLDSYYEWLRDGESESLCKRTFYPTALLNETGSMSFSSSRRSKLFAGGLLYSQFYASFKEIFAAGNRYPFTNQAIEALSLDPELRKTWEHVGAGLSHNPVALIKAYLYAKARCHYGLQGSMQKSFGLREEHRISTELFQAVSLQMEELGVHDSEIGASSNIMPFTTHKSKAALSWIRWNINKFCLGFETIYSINETRQVAWEHTRIMLIFLRCLQLSYGGGIISRSSGCWLDRRDVSLPHASGRVQRQEGLGFQVTLSRYGYAWFLDKIDWETMTFKAEYAPYMLFNNPSMQAAYRAHYRQIRDVQKDFITVDKVEQLMQDFSHIPTCQKFLEGILRQICLCVFRKDVFEDIKLLLKKSCREDAVAGKIPLCWPSLNQALLLPHRPPRLATGKRLSVQDFDVLFEWLWEWDDARFQRLHWYKKPYRMLYQRSFEAIQRINGKTQALRWGRSLKESLLKSHWILPYPQGNRFIKRDKGQVVWWSNYHSGIHAYHNTQEDLPETFPTSYLMHYPVHGWSISPTQEGYMPYVVAIEDQLSDMSDEEIYKEANHRAAQHQPQQSAEEGNSEADIELYCINIQSRTLRSSRRDRDSEANASALRLADELAEARKKLKQLQYRNRRKNIIESGNEAGTEEEDLQPRTAEIEDADSEEDPDSQRLKDIIKRQRKVVDEKKTSLEEEEARQKKAEAERNHIMEQETLQLQEQNKLQERDAQQRDEMIARRLQEEAQREEALRQAWLRRREEEESQRQRYLEQRRAEQRREEQRRVALEAEEGNRIARFYEHLVGPPPNWQRTVELDRRRPSHTRTIMARKREEGIKHPEKSHPILSTEEARRRKLNRQNDRRKRRKLENAMARTQ